MAQFILFYGMLLLLAAFICNGWYSITRGWWAVNPDGTKVWKGKVFNKFHYWLQRHTVKTVAYSGEEWLKILFQLKSFFADKDIISISENYLLIRPMDEIKTTMFFAFAASKGVKVNVNIMPGDSKEKAMMIVAYQEVKSYILPDLIRYPLGECLSCMSSLYGTLVWFCLMPIVFSAENIYSTAATRIFTALNFPAHILLWVFFCIILSHLNEIVFNINHKLSK